MPSFVYEARDRRGRRVHGLEIAPSERELDALLAERELVLVRTRRRRSRSRRRASTRTVIDFVSHMATVVEAGLPLLGGLRDLQEEGASDIADELEEIARKIEEGTPLSDAMGDHPHLFPELVRALVAAGEETGRLDEILRDLARHFEWREQLRRSVLAAVTYPCIVATGMLGLLVLLATVVLPNFLDIFAEFDMELPLLTRTLVAAQAFLTARGLHLFGAAVAVGAALLLWARTSRGRRSIDAAKLRIPILGRFVVMVEMSRFTHNLGLLFSAGIPLLRCLQLVHEIVQNRVMREVIATGEQHISQGETLSGALRREGLVTPMVVRLMQLGESTGRLDTSLERAASYYDRELPAQIGRLLTAFNAAALAVLGAALALVALGLFVPLYEMMGKLDAA